MENFRDDVDAIQDAWLRERPGTPVSSIGIITRIWRIGRLLDDDRRRTMARLGMDIATRDLLSTLRRAGSPYALTARELAQRCAITPGAVSQRVRRAEAQGLVARRPSGGDRRSVVIALTPAGHEFIEQSVDELLSHEDTLLSALDEDQRTALSDLLHTLLADLSQRGRERPR